MYKKIKLPSLKCQDILGLKISSKYHTRFVNNLNLIDRGERIRHVVLHVAGRRETTRTSGGAQERPSAGVGVFQARAGKSH